MFKLRASTLWYVWYERRKNNRDPHILEWIFFMGMPRTLHYLGEHSSHHIGSLPIILEWEWFNKCGILYYWARLGIFYTTCRIRWLIHHWHIVPSTNITYPMVNILGKKTHIEIRHPTPITLVLWRFWGPKPELFVELSQKASSFLVVASPHTHHFLLLFSPCSPFNPLMAPPINILFSSPQT